MLLNAVLFWNMHSTWRHITVSLCVAMCVRQCVRAWVCESLRSWGGVCWCRMSVCSIRRRGNQQDSRPCFRWVILHWWTHKGPEGKKKSQSINCFNVNSLFVWLIIIMSLSLATLVAALCWLNDYSLALLKKCFLIGLWLNDLRHMWAMWLEQLITF